MPPNERTLRRVQPHLSHSLANAHALPRDDGSATVRIIKPETKPEPHPLKIQWDSRTDRFIEYLTNHLEVRLKMFSNSVKDAIWNIIGEEPIVPLYEHSDYI